MTERRFDEDEVAEIFERATASDGRSSKPPDGSGQGLTLAELQEIGEEVGIPAPRIAEAARALSTRGVDGPAGVSRRVLGIPLGVYKSVSVPRALTEDEWTRLVVDLRETFDAVGRDRTAGDLRTWSNGNLRVHAEPKGDGYQVRMRTFKGNAGPLTAVGTLFIVMSALLLLLGVFDGLDFRHLILASSFGFGGLGVLGFLGTSLPRWARTRAAQMEGLAERIPLLMEESGATNEGRGME